VTTSAAGGGRRALVAGLVAALLVGALWGPLHERRPLLPTDDLYTHLSVARHLARGDGFRCDIAYPLSFAWPFARALPQPLVHRPPAWPVVLLLPWAAAGGDPDAAVAGVRALQTGVLALVAGLGVSAWLRRGRPGAAAAFLPALLACPLLPYAVDWGHTELAAGALLLGAWLRRREGAVAVGAADGLLTGALALLRPELAWLPPAWALLLRPGDAGTGRPAVARPWRGWLPALLVFAAVTAPWAARNARLTGDPFFSVQAAAEVVKDTRTWPGYDVYRQLTPQPAWGALRDDPAPIARKTARGLRFFAREWPGLLAWPLPVLLLAGCTVRARAAGPGARRRADPAAVAIVSLGALMALYAPLDHSLRHLLPLAPIIAWEAAPWLGEGPLTLWRRSAGSRGTAPRPLLAALVALAFATVLVALTTREPTGWAAAAHEAAALQETTRLETARLRALPPDEVAFTQTAAAPWFADRAAVWSPLDGTVADRIRAWLAPAAPAAPKGQP
jgi:hypothetical protein